MLSLRSHVLCFLKYVLSLIQKILLWSKHTAELLSSIHAYLSAPWKGPNFLILTGWSWCLLFVIFHYKSDKSIISFISLSYAYLRNGHELLQSSSSTPSHKVLIKLLGRQSCFPRPNQGLFHPALTQNLISESRWLMSILAS